MTEHAIQNAVLLNLGSRPDVRLFRNNVGTGYVGQVIRHTGDTILLRNPRPLHAGLHVGSADLIGWRTLVIGEEHLGERIGQFLSVEVKSGTGRLSPAQATWLSNVNAGGGLAVVADRADFKLPA